MKKRQKSNQKFKIFVWIEDNNNYWNAAEEEEKGKVSKGATKLEKHSRAHHFLDFRDLFLIKIVASLSCCIKNCQRKRLKFNALCFPHMDAATVACCFFFFCGMQALSCSLLLFCLLLINKRFPRWLPTKVIATKYICCKKTAFATKCIYNCARTVHVCL